MVIPVWFWVWLAIAGVTVYAAWVFTEQMKPLDDPSSAAALMNRDREQAKKQRERLREITKRAR